MALSTELLKNSSWNNAFQIKAPLTWANKQIEYLNANIQGLQSTYFSQLLNLTPVQYNTTFVNLLSYRTANFNSTGTITPTLAQHYLRLAMGLSNFQGTSLLLPEQSFVPKNQLNDLVALVTFVKISHLKETYPHVINPVTLQGFRQSPANSIRYLNYVSFLSETTTAPITPHEIFTTEYDEWVVPFIEWYYLPSDGVFPRTKQTMTTQKVDSVIPFVPYVSNSLYFFNTKNEEGFARDTQEIYNNTFYFNLAPSYIPFIAGALLNDEAHATPVDTITYQWVPHFDTTLPNDTQKYSSDLPVPYKNLILMNDADYNSITTRGKAFTTQSGVIPNINSSLYFVDLRAFRVARLVPAFETEQKALEYYADWGITCTQNLSEALNLIVTPTKPQDPPVVNIPSFPDNTTDTIEINPPSFTASTFGQCKVYTPLNTTNLIKWFGTNTFWQDINRLFADPMDAVFGLRLYNLDLLQHDNAHLTPEQVTTILNVSTDIPCYTMASGYNTIVNGGEYQLLAYYGNFADYLNTSYDIFIPYVGIRRLNPSDVVNRTLKLKYAVDFATGSATVFLLSDDKLIMTTACNVSSEIPIQTSNLNDVNFRTLMGVLTGAVSGAKTGFLTGSKTGSAAGSIGGTIGGAVIGGTLSGLDNYLNSIEYGYQGSVSGNNAYSTIEPFLIIRRFPIANTGDYSALYGLANASTVTFSSLTSGYIKADNAEINTRATNKERDEIVALLQAGVHIK